MRLITTPLPPACVIELQRFEDERGWFARSFCVDTLARAGIGFEVVQANISYNRRRGTVRGMHWQDPEHPEPKIVRCCRGAIHDVIVDLRPDSPRRFAHHAVRLDATGGRALYVPAGFAHGFQTLEDDTEVHYLMGGRYVPEAARGARWDDPRLAIRWPLPVAVISERDRSFPELAP
ncbi:MAG: dTDP-4-dehydrorhamnose 3,5-epimerase [Planctomycetota bacterium]|nr:MAG: dTDP-4-dehydrorhamnose 3,5-epimerase [Planctomycetota bacterium]